MMLHMRINWIEDQPSIRPVRVQLEQSGLIHELVTLIAEHDLTSAQAHKRIEFPTGTTHEYICEVVRNSAALQTRPDLLILFPYSVYIRQEGLPTSDAIGEIYSE